MQTKSPYTVFVRTPEHENWLEEHTVTATSVEDTPRRRYTAALVIEENAKELVKAYGSLVEVVRIDDQTTGERLFDSAQEGYRSLPVALPIASRASFPYPYDALLDLMQEAADGLGSEEYIEWLLTSEG